MIHVVVVTTPLSSATAWAACRVYVTSVELCQRVCAVRRQDNAPARKESREPTVPAVFQTTIIVVWTMRVRKVKTENWILCNMLGLFLLTKFRSFTFFVIV